MSRWDETDTGYEDFDPNKDYSVQVQKNDGGLSSTQVSDRGVRKIQQRWSRLTVIMIVDFSEHFKKSQNRKK